MTKGRRVLDKMEKRIGEKENGQTKEKGETCKSYPMKHD